MANADQLFKDLIDYVKYTGKRKSAPTTIKIESKSGDYPGDIHKELIESRNPYPKEIKEVPTDIDTVKGIAKKISDDGNNFDLRVYKLLEDGYNKLSMPNLKAFNQVLADGDPANRDGIKKKLRIKKKGKDQINEMVKTFNSFL